MHKILLVFLGGGVGSVARYVSMNGISRFFPSTTFPYHTLIVNVLGAFIIGVLLEMLALRTTLSSEGKLLLVTGFCGGYTTFSAFSLESALMIEKGAYGQFALYAGASVFITIVAVFLGSGAVKMVS